MRTGSHLLSGALAGAITVLAFTVVHDLLISDIWFSLVPMMVAGVLCGTSLAWTYGLLFDERGPGSWGRYVGLHLGLLLALGLVSVVLFEPVTSIQALLLADGPPDELIRDALPLTVVFTLAAAALVSVLWGREPAKFASALVTCTLLTVLLGLNVSVLGLVEMSGGIGVLTLFFALLAAIMVGYGGVFFVLERGATLAPGSVSSEG